MKNKSKNSSSSLKNNPSQERYNIIQSMSSIVDLMIHLYQTILESLLNNYTKQLTHWRTLRKILSICGFFPLFPKTTIVHINSSKTHNNKWSWWIIHSKIPYNFVLSSQWKIMIITFLIYTQLNLYSCKIIHSLNYS